MELSSAIDSEWASLVLLSLWDGLRSTNDYNRPHVKAALKELLQSPIPGNSRSLEDLALLIDLCDVEKRQVLKNIAEMWDVTGEQHARFMISGDSLPTTTDARSLARNFKNSIHSISGILSGQSSPHDLFPSQNFPHLSMLPNTGHGREVWKEIQIRLALVLRFYEASMDDQLGAVPKSSKIQLHSSVDQARFIDSDTIESTVININEEITNYPVVEQHGAYWSSPWLLLDSLAPWLLQKFQQSDFRQKIVSQVFEDKVVDLFRECGFEAGPVSEKGVWKTQFGAKPLGDAEEMPGEIDVLALRWDAFFLIECKPIYSMGEPRNIAEKIGTLDNEWLPRL